MTYGVRHHHPEHKNDLLLFKNQSQKHSVVYTVSLRPENLNEVYYDRETKTSKL